MTSTPAAQRNHHFGGEQAVIGVDVGGSKVAAVLVDAGGSLVAEVRAPTDSQGPTAVLGSILTALERLRSEAGMPFSSVGGVGVGFPGLVDHRTGWVSHAVNLGIGDAPVAIGPDVARFVGAPCVVENDVNAAALGALRMLNASLGSGGEVITDLAFLSVGTGVAAGVVLGGKIHRGHRGVAGEVGHLPVVVEGPRCECGQRGCLEAVASGAAIARLWPAEGGVSPAVSLFAAAADGDPRAVDLVSSLARSFARTVQILALTFDVDRIVLGGGVAEVGQPLVDAIGGVLTRAGRESEFVRTLDLPQRVVAAAAGPIGALGAAAAARAASRSNTGDGCRS